jgi:hypothetical protein
LELNEVKPPARKIAEQEINQTMRVPENTNNLPNEPLELFTSS